MASPSCAPTSTGSGPAPFRPTRPPSNNLNRRADDDTRRSDHRPPRDRGQRPDRARLLGLHRGLRQLQATRAQPPRRRDRRDRVRTARRRPPLRPRRRWQRVQLGARARLRPTDRVVISWDINPRWQIETDPEKTSEVEIRFTAETPERTRVELEHRNLDRHLEGWEAVRDGVDSEGGWPLYLQRFAELLDGQQAS